MPAAGLCHVLEKEALDLTSSQCERPTDGEHSLSFQTRDASDSAAQRPLIKGQFMRYQAPQGSSFIPHRHLRPVHSANTKTAGANTVWLSQVRNANRGQLWLKWPRLLVVHRVHYSHWGGNEQRKKDIISKVGLMLGVMISVKVSADKTALHVEDYQWNIVFVRLKRTEKRYKR